VASMNDDYRTYGSRLDLDTFDNILLHHGKWACELAMRRFLVHRLRLIASKPNQVEHFREQVIMRLVEILAEDNDASIRADVISFFEDEKICGTSDLVRRIVDWCETAKMNAVNKTILLTDDEEVVIRCQKRMLQKYFGFKNILVEQKPFKAIETVEKIKPDLVITDTCKPGMSGPEMAKQIKEIAPETPIIVISGWYMDVMEEDNFLFCAGLSKPWNSNEFHQIVFTALAGKYKLEI